MEVTTELFIPEDSLEPLTLTTGDYILIIDLGIEHFIEFIIHLEMATCYGLTHQLTECTEPF